MTMQRTICDLMLQGSGLVFLRSGAEIEAV
jgi:hypothetical protein